MWEFTRKMPQTKTAAHTLCWPAQSTCTWTCHENPVYARICRKNDGKQMEHPDQASALTPTVRTPECGHTVWRKKVEPPLRIACKLDAVLRHGVGLRIGWGKLSAIIAGTANPGGCRHAVFGRSMIDEYRRSKGKYAHNSLPQGKGLWT